METHIPESLSQDTINPQTLSPAQTVAANICSANPVALCLLEQMAHPASMIMQASQLNGAT